MTNTFNGKVVVVSGASRGIGLTIAQTFARGDAQTVIAASSEARLADAVNRIEETGALKPIAVAADLRTLDGCAAVLRAVTERVGRCDVLVNFCRRYSRWGLSCPARRRMAVRICTEVLFVRAALPAFLAAAASLAGCRHQHHRRRRAHARCRVPRRRFG